MATTVSEQPFRLSLKEKATITRQLSALIDAGMPVVKALKVLLKQYRKPRIHSELKQVIQDLEEGVSLSHSFRRWDQFMISLLKAGETAGALTEVLDRLARFYEERFRLQTKVVTTLTYPLIILGVSLCIFAGMVVFILPQFSQIYGRLGGELPPYTQFWMDLSNALRSPWGFGILALLALGGYGIARNQEQYLSTLEKACLKVPVLGEVITQFAATRFARSLGTLLRCGVPLNQSLQLSAVSVFPTQAIQEEISEGIPLNQAMEKRGPLFPEMLTAMVAVGEETGELNKLLLKAADYYDQELEGLLSRLTSLIEPAIIILLGGLIGSVVVGMYLPMFQIFNQVQ